MFSLTLIDDESYNVIKVFMMISEFLENIAAKLRYKCNYNRWLRLTLDE